MLCTGDLVAQRVDAIVNPANVRLAHGSGAARAISEAAGPELKRECESYIRKYGQLKTAEVMHTTAGKLRPKISVVMHAPGPNQHEVKDMKKSIRLVEETFLNCFVYANKHKYESIAVPAISSGLPSLVLCFYFRLKHLYVFMLLFSF